MIENSRPREQGGESPCAEYKRRLFGERLLGDARDNLPNHADIAPVEPVLNALDRAAPNGRLRGDDFDRRQLRRFLLERLGFDGTSAGDAAREQVNVASFCYLLTLYLLEKNAPKFQSMEP